MRIAPRLLARLVETRRSAVLGCAFAATSVVLGWAVFGVRPKAIAFTTLIWSAFFVLLHRHRYGPLALQAAAVFWVVCLADTLNFSSPEAATVVAYTGLLTLMSGSALALHQWLPKRIRFVGLGLAGGSSALLCAVAAVYIWHRVVFNAAVTPDIFYALYQTDAQESTEFVREMFDSRLAISCLLGMGIVVLIGAVQARIPGNSVRLAPIAAVIVSSLGLLAPTWAEARLLVNVVEHARQYRRELTEFRRLRDLRTAGRLTIRATKQGRSETYVVVIGESLNRNHMQLYGYHRPTTPRLGHIFAAGELLKFENAHSTHTNTMPALSLALTAANRRNGLAFFEAASILEVARAAGMETRWITNQVLYGPFDHLVSIIAHGSHTLIALNGNVGATAETQRHDEATVEALRTVLADDTTRNRLIFVHLMGSHTLYHRRFPDRFRHFSGPLRAGDFGKAHGGEDRAQRVNSYDNSVLYNDYVVSGLLDTVREHGGVAGFLYFADHGEDVLARNGHHPGRFTFSMAEIPMLAWFSEGYRREYHARYDALRGRVNAIFGTDFVFDTVLGMAGVETPQRDELSDLSGPAWGRAAMELDLLDGTRNFLEEANVRYHQRANLAKLAQRDLLSRILPHRVNSIGKLSQVLYDGWRGLEVDALYRTGGEEEYFEVGHDEGHASANRVSDVLERMPAGRPRKLWLDVKNLDAGNVDALTSHLIRLDGRFGLKGAMIFESQAAELLPRIAREGFHTSYYLPTELLDRLSKARDTDGLDREARRIARVVGAGGLSAVSFAASLYPFVKEHLEPLLPATVAYHTWDTTLDLASPSFLPQLMATGWFADRRVQTILVTYHSELDL